MSLLFVRIAALFVLFRLGRSFVLLGCLQKLRAREGAASRLDEVEVPPHLATLLSETDDWSALGFEHAAWVRDEAVFGLPPYEPRIRRVMHRPGSGLWLWLDVGDASRPGRPLQAMIVSHDSSGDGLRSCDAEGAAHWMRYPEGVRFELLPGVAPEALLEAHRARAGTDLELTPDLDAHLALVATTHERIIEHAIRVGDLRRGEDGFAEPRLRALLGPAWRGPSEGARLVARQKLDASLEPLPIELELDAWRRADALRAAKGSSGLGLAAMAVTAGLFMASLSFDLAIVDVLVLAAVVAFHEGGHWAAMRLRGYHDARVFFVPFLGGATVGHKERASLSDELVMLLAGPVPGMALGLGLLVVGAFTTLPGLAFRAAVMLIVVNGLNLLPLFPLDGGRVVHRLVARGRPGVELVLRVIGVLGLFALAVWWETWILGAVAAMLALLIPYGQRVANVERTVLDAGVPEERNERRRAILLALREALPTVPAVLRVARAREVEGRIDAPRGSLAARALWGIVYVGVIGVPLGGWAFAMSLAPEEEERVWVPCEDVDRTLAELDADVVFAEVAPYAVDDVLEIPDALRAYGFANLHVCAAPPWSAPADEDRRARDGSLVRVVDTAHEAERAVPALVRDGDERPSDDALRRHREARAEARAAALRARFGDDDGDPLDARIASAWLVLRDPMADDEARETARSELAAALDWPSECGDEPPLGISIAHDGIDVPVGGMSLVGLAPMAHWLCDAGATGFVLRVTHSAR